MEFITLPLEGIRINGGTQSRLETNEVAVAEYAEFIRSGGDLPPIIVFDDGAEIWLADGFHRFHAHHKAGAMEIACDVRRGTKRDAILFSVGANASHGLRRSNSDKRKAVITLLNDCEWSAWSDREIARQCSVSHEFVRHQRAAICQPLTDSAATRTVERNGTTYQQNIKNIGRTTPAPDPFHSEDSKVAASIAQPTSQAFPVKSESTRVRDAAPTPALSEIDMLREALTEARDTGSLLAEELEAYRAVEAGTQFEEIKKLQDRNRILQSQLDDYINQNQQLKRQVKMLERRAGGQNA